jgi:hypothetical protein
MIINMENDHTKIGVGFNRHFHDCKQLVKSKSFDRNQTIQISDSEYYKKFNIVLKYKAV